MEKLKRIINMIHNMGLRYILFRVQYEIQKRTGTLKKKFPVQPPYQQYIKLQEWKNQKTVFFFESKEKLNISKRPSASLKERHELLKEGKLLFFNSIAITIGRDYDWITNPDTGYQYDIKQHWTEISDFNPTAGDIKYVWEKSRFSYLYDIIRYDYHFKEDCAEMVFNDMLSWIASNPINCGPNYFCSQETSLRVLNWIFALNYYKNSPYLTENVFNKIQYVLYWQIHHVFHNINFSRIAVRNNHAITETLALYLVGLLFPTLPGAATWKQKGKEWFEQEIAYQIYADGTYLQFSMNYHRVVVQLLTWGIKLSELNGENFSPIVYERATKSMQFLRTCMVDENGQLPNFGTNDGALFFKLNDNYYRDYRCQLQALANVLGLNLGFSIETEDELWYGKHNNINTLWQPAIGVHKFITGGYYLIREPETLTFIVCNSHKDRPHQADNLHLDIWYKGENILLDAGSYKYNTDDATLKYFSGTTSHNTVMLGDKDQMLKGGRFIWYYWSQCINADIEKGVNEYEFIGSVSVYQYLNKNIAHQRIVRKKIGEPIWEIIDEITPGGVNGLAVRQLWHKPKNSINNISINAKDNNGNILSPILQDGWYSGLYGQKELTQETIFTRAAGIISTTIDIT